MLTSEDEWLSGKRDGITLVKYPHMRVVLVALRKGTRMREHKMRGPISLFVVQGRIHIEAGSTSYKVRKKELVTLRTAILHDVQADQDSVFLLTITSPTS
jgi:quercetin dioxygenase-like cupin family protein